MFFFSRRKGFFGREGRKARRARRWVGRETGRGGCGEGVRVGQRRMRRIGRGEGGFREESDVAETCRAFRGDSRAHGDAMGVGARAGGPGSGPRAKRWNRSTELAIARCVPSSMMCSRRGWLYEDERRLMPCTM